MSWRETNKELKKAKKVINLSKNISRAKKRVRNFASRQKEEKKSGKGRKGKISKNLRKKEGLT